MNTTLSLAETRIGQGIRAQRSPLPCPADRDRRRRRSDKSKKGSPHRLPALPSSDPSIATHTSDESSYLTGTCSP